MLPDGGGQFTRVVGRSISDMDADVAAWGTINILETTTDLNLCFGFRLFVSDDYLVNGSVTLKELWQIRVQQRKNKNADALLDLALRIPHFCLS